MISDDEIAAAQSSLDEAMDRLGNTALKIKAERDQAIYVLDTLIANMREWSKLPVSEGNSEAGAFATMLAHGLDYAREQRRRFHD